MKKNILFLFIIVLVISCSKSKTSIAEDDSYESVMVSADATATPCTGWYLFKDSASVKYQTFDSLPGNPPIGLSWVSAKIKFHIINGYHCPWISARIIVDEIKF